MLNSNITILLVLFVRHIELQNFLNAPRSNVDAEHENANIFGIMTDSIENSTASPGLSTMTSSMTVTTNDCDNDQRADMVI